MQLHGLGSKTHALRPSIHRFDRDPSLLASICHYLASADHQALLRHRLMEILLVLLGREQGLAAYLFDQGNWGNRVRAILAQDLAHEWEIQEVCERLATTESTLRRNLRKESTGFRELLHDLRLTTALMHLLQTPHPINRIAYDCGFQSMSRFSNNFHKRFGLPPSQFRESMRDSEHNLSVTEQLPST
jgi:AraC-like DNA-binding protein